MNDRKNFLISVKALIIDFVVIKRHHYFHKKQGNTMSQVFNFSAGPAMIFPEVLQKHKMNL